MVLDGPTLLLPIPRLDYNPSHPTLEKAKEINLGPTFSVVVTLQELCNAKKGLPNILYFS
jgi:hypothetical protein